MLTLAGSCSSREEGNKIQSASHSHIDSMVRAMCSQVYASPDSIACFARTMMDTTPDNVSRHYLATILAFSRLLQGDSEEYDSLMQTTHRFLVENPDEKRLSEFHNRLKAVAFNLLGKNDSAYLYMGIALREALANSDFQLAVEDEASLGDLSEANSQLPLAARHLRKAIQLADSSGYSGRRSFHVSLAAIYASMGNYEEADRYFDMHHRKMDLYPDYINFFYYSSLGNRYYYQKRYLEAQPHFSKALELSTSLGDPYLIAMTKVNLGECMLYSGNIDSAGHYIEEGAREFRSMDIQDRTQKAYIQSLMGDLEARKGDMDKAYRTLSAIGEDTIVLPPKYRMLHYRRMVNLLKMRGDYKSALEYLDKAQNIERALTDIDARNYAAELESRYMQDTTILQAKMNMASKEEEIFRMRAWTYMSIAGGLIVVFISMFLISRNNRKKHEAIEQMQRSLTWLRLEGTRHRVSPHFIFNVLNSEIDTNSDKTLMKLVELIRLNLEMAERPTVPIKDELEFINKYVEIKSNALGDNFTYELEVSKDVNLNRVIPSMIIQIFVENAMKHGLQGFDGRKLLRLSFSHSDKGLEVEVINNGHMISHANIRGTGSGLRIVNQTIQTLNSVNSRHIQMEQEIIDCPGVDGKKCYRVHIIIPDSFDFSALESTK